MVNDEILSAARTINECIIEYCRKNKLTIKSSCLGKLKVDDKFKPRITYAVKFQVYNWLTTKYEIMIFCGRRAKFGGTLLIEVKSVAVSVDPFV